MAVVSMIVFRCKNLEKKKGPSGIEIENRKEGFLELTNSFVVYG